jgi:hypothetical protein
VPEFIIEPRDRQVGTPFDKFHQPPVARRSAEPDGRRLRHAGGRGFETCAAIIRSGTPAGYLPLRLPIPSAMSVSTARQQRSHSSAVLRPVSHDSMPLHRHTDLLRSRCLGITDGRWSTSTCYRKRAATQGVLGLTSRPAIHRRRLRLRNHGRRRKSGRFCTYVEQRLRAGVVDVVAHEGTDQVLPSTTSALRTEPIGSAVQRRRRWDRCA